VSQISETSRAVALITHALRQSPQPYVPDQGSAWLHGPDQAEAELLRRAGGPERFFLPLIKVEPLRRLALASVDWRVPHTTGHLLWRRSWFYAHARQFLSQPGQVLCLGAGLDPLGFRLARSAPDSRVVEVDRAAVTSVKQGWLRSSQRPPANLRQVSMDLLHEDCCAQDLEVLPNRRTLVLAEGLLMYLDPASVHRLLAELAGWFSQPWQLAFSCLDPATMRQTRSPIARLARGLRRRGRGERFGWAREPDELANWLTGAGFAFHRAEDSTAFIGSRYGEFIATASHPGRQETNMS